LPQMISVDSDDFARVMNTYSTQQGRINELLKEIAKQVEKNRSLDWVSEVRSLFYAFGQTIPEKPGWPDVDTIQLRLDMMVEEFEETTTAAENGDFVEFVDGCIDVMVVTVGALIACGVDPRPVWTEVMKTNFAKANGPIREDGKRLKPAGWTPPDIAGELKKQGWVQLSLPLGEEAAE
jgi:predicted HAD superfamily Cof-like phosphohydrolase